MAAEERPCGVERTLVLVDAELPAFSLRDASLGVDKSSQTLAIEAVTEYSRLFFDLFPAAFMCVCVGAVKSENGEPLLQRLNLWAPQRQQALQRIVERFSGVQFSASRDERAQQAEEGEVSELTLEASVRKAVALLSEGEEKRTTTLRTRVVCLYGQRPKGEDNELIKAAAEALRKLPSVVLCDLVLVGLRAKGPVTKRPGQVPRAVNPSLTVMRHDCLIEQLPQFSLTLASEHFGLRHLRVTGIPMKESNKEASERIISDVTILHPMAAHSPLAPDAFAAAPLDKPREQTLVWRTVDKKTNALAIPCYCTHRVTPLQPFSSAAICLFRHLQTSGKPALLAASDTPNSQPTHLLLMNGGEVWLHCLHNTPVEALPPAALAAYGRRANEYRVESFTSLINSNTLYAPPAKKKGRTVLSSFFRTVPTAHALAAAAVPATPKAPPPPLAQLEAAPVPYNTTKSMERTTRYFPLLETDTLLCAHEQSQSPALRSFVEPLRATLNSETTDEAQTAQAIEILAKLQQYAVQNEPSVFPPLAQNIVARQEAYKRLWLELLLVARRSHRLMPLSNHGKIVSAMERIWPELSGLPPEVKDEDKPDKERDPKQMKIEPNIGAAVGAEGELTRRAMQEMQMLRDREREREEEERRAAAREAAGAAAGGAEKKPTLGKRDRTGVGRHKDLDTPQEDSFYSGGGGGGSGASAAPAAAGAKRERTDGGNGGGGGGGGAGTTPIKAERGEGGLKLALRRKRSLIAEQHTRTVYGLFWNAVQAKRAPVRDFDGRADET